MSETTPSEQSLIRAREILHHLGSLPDHIEESTDEHFEYDVVRLASALEPFAADAVLEALLVVADNMDAESYRTAALKLADAD